MKNRYDSLSKSKSQDPLESRRILCGANAKKCAEGRIGIAARDIYVGSKGHIGTYTEAHICIPYTRTPPPTHTRALQRDIYRHAHVTLHGWPTNLRFYSSSQLFGWLNCYKGTLLRSTVFARYILVHFVYGLWLTRFIRFAMFLLHGPTRGARIAEIERRACR